MLHIMKIFNDQIILMRLVLLMNYLQIKRSFFNPFVW
jgi:hypothetical protein